MATLPKLAWFLWLAALPLGVAGCSQGDRPELGRVGGVITLNGKPLSGAIVWFSPDTGRAATATTEEDGAYELMYLHGVKGAKVGPNTVSISWPDGEPGPVPIPAKYGGNSELKVDVQPGKNTFDFALDSN